MTKPSDALVIGAGIFGLSAAYGLLRSGFSVTVIDKGAPGAGASGGVVGALSPHLPELWNEKKTFQLSALIEAADFWKEIEAISGMPTGYARNGRLMPIISEKGLGLAQERIGGAAEFWPKEFAWTIMPSHDALAETATPFGVVHETLSARINPRLACAALAQAVQKRGGLLRIGEVERIDPGGVVLVSGEVVASETLVVAAAHNSFGLLPFPDGFGSELKGQAALLAGVDLTGPLIFADGIYVLPHGDGLVAVGSTNETEYDAPFATDAKLDDVISRASAIVPALAQGRVVERWAGLRPRSQLPDPIMGRMGNAIVVAGGFKIGFGLAAGVARTVQDLASGVDIALPEKFSPELHLARFHR